MINKALDLLSNFVKSIPNGLMGPDRTSYIVEKTEELPSEEKETIIKFFNHILTVMVDREASDVEIGGHGTANFIWFRVQGI